MRRWRRSGEYFALRIRGDSMEPRMRSGKILIIVPAVRMIATAADVANCNDWRLRMLPAMRRRKLDGGIMLIPDNQKYDPMIYTRAEAQQIGISILGKVSGASRPLLSFRHWRLFFHGSYIPVCVRIRSP